MSKADQASAPPNDEAPGYAEPPPPYSGPQGEGYKGPQGVPQPQPGYQPQPQQGYPQPGYPQPGYPAGGHMGGVTATTVIVTQPVLGPHPLNMSCPKCHAQVVTETTATAGTLAWLICVLCLVFGFWLGCCLIPFCINECQDVEHRCPNCKAYLGTYRRM